MRFVVKKFLSIIFMILALSLNVQAATWVQVGDYEYIDKDSVEYYIDDHEELQFNKKIFWLKIDNKNNTFKEVEKDIKRKISYSLQQKIINTTQKKLTTKSIILYDKQDNSVFSYTYKDFELNWSAIVPNTNGEFWYELVKKPKYLKKLYKMQLMEQSRQE